MSQPVSRRVVAYHEAGHTVAALHHGYNVPVVRALPGPGTGPGSCMFWRQIRPMTWNAYAFSQSMIDLAALVAEELVGPKVIVPGHSHIREVCEQTKDTGGPGFSRKNTGDTRKQTPRLPSARPSS